MIFSILAFLTLFISICVIDRKKSLTVQSLNCIFKGMYDLSINAYTATILDLVNFIRSFLFIRKEKFSKILYLILLIAFELIIIIGCVLTWNGIISLLPTIGSGIKTYCLWQSNMKYIRISGIVSGILFGLYYVHYSGWLMALGYFLLAIIAFYNVCKIDMKLHIFKYRTKATNVALTRLTSGVFHKEVVVSSFHLLLGHPFLYWSLFSTIIHRYF